MFSLVPASSIDGVAGHAVHFDGHTVLGPAKDYVVRSNFTFACWFRTTRSTPLAEESTSGIEYDDFNTLLGAGQTERLGTVVGCGIAVRVNGINLFEHNSYYRPGVRRRRRLERGGMRCRKLPLGDPAGRRVHPERDRNRIRTIGGVPGSGGGGKGLRGRRLRGGKRKIVGANDASCIDSAALPVV